jgi:hypothetical protein
MPGLTSAYGPGIQHLPPDAAPEGVLMLLKRDGGVTIKHLVSHRSIDKTYSEIRPKIDGDREWKGTFFLVTYHSALSFSNYPNLIREKQNVSQELPESAESILKIN